MRQVLFTAVLTATLALTGAAMAGHKAGHTKNNPAAPGQDRVCLVTTAGGASGAITRTKWLPRKAAQAQADNQTTFIGTNPIVATKEGCESLNPR